MSQKLLYTRVVLAIIAPGIVVTAILYPLFQAYLEARLDDARIAAEAMLETGQTALQRGVDESLNDILSVAEFPQLKRYLTNVGGATPPYQTTAAPMMVEKLAALFETLLSHSPRYTKMVLIDTQGEELLRVSHGSHHVELSRERSHESAPYFHEAMSLFPRDIYFTPPSHVLRYENSYSKQPVPVVDIATPVFDTQGQRKGVLLFSLDWKYLTADMERAMSLNKEAQPILVDAAGRWLLTGTGGKLRFGQPLEPLHPEAWEELSQRSQDQVHLGDHLLIFVEEDIRTQAYRSLAGTVFSPSQYKPWRLGILLPKPSLSNLLPQDAALRITSLLYGLAILFAMLWAISSYRQHKLKRETQQYASEVRNLYEHAPCGYHSLNADGRIVKMNRTELKWLGYRADEIIGHRFYRDFVTPETREDFEAAFQDVLGPGQEGAAECELLKRDGSVIPVAIQATAYTTRKGFMYTRATVFDLSERKRLEDTLAKQAMTDPLTGLGNRRFLQEQAALELARSERSGLPLSLVVADLDHFKGINDEYGHDIGDMVLQAFARTAKEALREGDVICRMGGEEFALLLNDTSQIQAIMIAERLRQTIEDTPIEVGCEVTQTGRLHYTASFGVTSVASNEHSLKPAIKRADLGLYAAKEKGRNRVHWQAG